MSERSEITDHDVAAPAIVTSSDRELMAFAVEIDNIEQKALRMGLIMTMHALNAAKRRVGFETAAIITQRRKAGRMSA